METPAPAVPMGHPVLAAEAAPPALSAEEKKFERQKKRAVYFSAAAGGVLTLVASARAWNGSAKEACNDVLVRAVMVWMAGIGLLLVMSEVASASPCSSADFSLYVVLSPHYKPCV